MSEDDVGERIREKIARLRKRLEQVPQRSEADTRVVGVIKGILDLLGDEL